MALTKVSVYLLVLSYCRKIVVQLVKLCEEGPAPYVDINGSFYGNENKMT